MGWTDLLLRLRALVRHRRAEGDLDEELNFHLEMQVRKYQAAGMADAEARQSARAGFGGLEQTREQCRDIRGLTVLENLVRDVRFGARVLGKTPVFTVIAVLSLAIGIGANTAVFSLLDRVLLQKLPVRHPEQLVVARWGASKDLDLNSTWASGSGDGHGGFTTNVFSWAIFSGMRVRSKTIGEVIGFSPLGPVNVAVNGQALSTGAIVVSGNYFQVLGVGAVLGRLITNDDDMAGGLPAAIISYRFWERAFALAPSVVGKTMYVNGRPCIVIGITPKEFFGVSAGGFLRTPQVDITLPIRSRQRVEDLGGSRVSWFGDDLFWVQVMARLNPGVTQPAAKSELNAIVAAGLPEDSRRTLGSETPRIFLDPGGQGLDWLRRVYHQPLLILMAVVGLTLLMACANLAGLLLARATARQREIMVRLALGASRGRLVRQLLLEGALLSAIGAMAGLVFAYWGVQALVAMVASGTAPIPIAVSPDARVLGFTIMVSSLATLLFALAPAMRATGIDVANGLKQETAGAPANFYFGMGRMLLAMQVAMALVLLAGATLFTRSLANLRSLPLGFNPHKLVLFDLAPGKNGYDETRGNQLYARVLDRLEHIPGVTGATLSAQRLITGWVSNGPILIEGARAKAVGSKFNFVGPRFFEVMGIPVILGRGLELRDMGVRPRIAVINESLARRAFGDRSPVGRKFRWEFKKEWDVEVIGVVKDAKYDRLRDDESAIIYAPHTQTPWGWPGEMTFEVRTVGSISAAIASIRHALLEIDSMLPLTDVKTQEAQVDDFLAQERLFAWLVNLFSAIALLLTCVGLYGSVAYTVTRRTREFGVRMALGADRLAVMRMLLSQVVATIGVGLAIGLPSTWVLTRIIESQLYGIKPHDSISLLVACASVTLVAILAAFLPACRATRIDPVQALRYE